MAFIPENVLNLIDACLVIDKIAQNKIKKLWPRLSLEKQQEIKTMLMQCVSLEQPVINQVQLSHKIKANQQNQINEVKELKNLIDNL